MDPDLVRSDADPRASRALRATHLLPDRLRELWHEVEAGRRSADDYEPLKEQWMAEHQATWASAVLLPGIADLKTSLLTEMGRYVGCDVGEVERRCLQSGDEQTREWDATVDVSSRASVERFYDVTQLEIYRLGWWHTLTEDLTPLSYVIARQFAQAQGWCTRYLDFGSGIGSGALVFGHAAFATTCADISSTLLAFCRFRRDLRSRPGSFIDLREEALPAGAYDFITAMDVFEHLYDPVEAIEQLHRALAAGGFIMGRWAVEPGDTRRQHIVTDLGAMHRRAAELGLVEVWRDDWIWGHQIFRNGKGRVGPV